MRWLLDEISRLIKFFSYKESWIGLGMLCVVCILSYMAIRYAYKFDFISKINGLTTGCYSELNNTIILISSFLSLAFALSSVLLFGEFINYVDAKRRKRLVRSKKLLLLTLLNGAISTSTGTALTIILFKWC